MPVLFECEDEPVEHEIVFWQDLLSSNDPGSTTWEALEHLYERFRRAMEQDPPDFGLARHLTANALMLIRHGKIP